MRLATNYLKTWKVSSTFPFIKRLCRIGFVNANGVRLHYIDWRGQGETLLFLTGGFGTAHDFDHLAPKFTDCFRVLGLTRRGAGASDKPESGYDTDTLVEDIKQVLDRLNIECVHLIGYSLAGDELTRFAGLYPERIGKLVYLDAAYDRTNFLDRLAQDPLARPLPPGKIAAALIKGTMASQPDYTKIEAPALSFYAVYDTHPDLQADTEEAVRKAAEDYWNRYGKTFRREQIERFRREVKKGRVVELHNTNHGFFKDPKLQDELVQMIKDFLLEADRG
jgi:pimeloyl-ACP methyl ester carboxylesterase